MLRVNVYSYLITMSYIYNIVLTRTTNEDNHILVRKSIRVSVDIGSEYFSSNVSYVYNNISTNLLRAYLRACRVIFSQMLSCNISFLKYTYLMHNLIFVCNYARA